MNMHAWRNKEAGWAREAVRFASRLSVAAQCQPGVEARCGAKVCTKTSQKVAETENLKEENTHTHRQRIKSGILRVNEITLNESNAMRIRYEWIKIKRMNWMRNDQAKELNSNKLSLDQSFKQPIHQWTNESISQSLSRSIQKWKSEVNDWMKWMEKNWKGHVVESRRIWMRM